VTLRSLADKRSIRYLQVFEEISKRLNGSNESFRLRISLVLSSACRRYLFRQKFDDIAHAHGYTMLADEVHRSDRSGHVVADLVSKWLMEIPL
jgi:hypothetical protein